MSLISILFHLEQVLNLLGGKKMIKVSYIPCLFEDRRIEFASQNTGIPAILFSFVHKFPEIWQDSPNICIRVNGRKLSPFKWKETVVQDGDRVMIIQETGAEAIVALLGAVGIVVGELVTTIATIVDVVLTVATVAYSIYSAVNRPDTPKTGQGLVNSPTYGWDTQMMQIRPGVPVPVVYGQHCVPGNLIGCIG